MHGAPADQDKPTTLPMLDEVLSLAPALKAGWAAERAAIPPGTLVNDGGDDADTGGEPGGDTDADTGPDAGQPGGDEEESFIDSFDLDSVPSEARPHVEALQREWQGNYTQRRQADRRELAEVRREAEQDRALLEGLADPETRPHYLRLLGDDQADDARRAEDELSDLLGDEPDDSERIDRLEAQIASQREMAEDAAEQRALDELADQELEAIEGQWGRKLDPEEDEILRLRAESHPGRDGLPDYAAAAKLLRGVLGNGVERELKRRSEPGRGLPGGKPGGKALDPSKEEDRIALAAAAAERAMASEK